MINLSNTLKKKNNKKGFTLIELIVVVAILGILAAIAVPRLMSSRDKANWSAHAGNIRTIESAITMYQAEGGDIATLAVSNAGVESGGTGNEHGNFVENYLNSWPTQPGTYTVVAGKVVATPDVTATEASENSKTNAKFE